MTSKANNQKEKFIDFLRDEKTAKFFMIPFLVNTVCMLLAAIFKAPLYIWVIHIAVWMVFHTLEGMRLASLKYDREVVLKNNLIHILLSESGFTYMILAICFLGIFFICIYPFLSNLSETYYLIISFIIAFASIWCATKFSKYFKSKIKTDIG